MAVALKDIQSSQWSISMSDFGEVVTDLEDIKQCLYILLFTPKGTAPFWLDFGCGLYEWIDEPMTIAAPKIVKDIRYAINQWETRVNIVDLTYSFSADGVLHIYLTWLPVTATSGTQVTGTAFAVKEGTFYLVDEFNRNFITPYGVLVL